MGAIVSYNVSHVRTAAMQQKILTHTWNLETAEDLRRSLMVFSVIHGLLQQPLRFHGRIVSKQP